MLTPLDPSVLADMRGEFTDWAYVFGEQSGASIAPVGFTRADVAELYHATSEGERGDEAWAAAGRLADGRYFVVSGWCDYTGWG